MDIEQTIINIIKTKSAMISISDSLFPILTTMGLSEGFICSEISDVGMGGRSVIMRWGNKWKRVKWLNTNMPFYIILHCSSMFVKRGSPTRGIFNTK